MVACDWSARMKWQPLSSGRVSPLSTEKSRPAKRDPSGSRAKFQSIWLTSRHGPIRRAMCVITRTSTTGMFIWHRRSPKPKRRAAFGNGATRELPLQVLRREWGYLHPCAVGERPKDGRAMSEPKKDGDGLRGRDPQQGDLRDVEDGDRELPEGLKRDRKGPGSKQGGRSARQD